MTYFTNKERTEIAFCMPCDTLGTQNYKIVRQNKKRRDSLIRIIQRNFKTMDSAQEKLDKIAAVKGWEPR